MSEQTLFERLGQLCAVLKANRETEVQALDDFLSFLYKNAVLEYDVSKIRWEGVEGPRGPYERASEDSIDFNLLLKDLNQHEGRLTLDSARAIYLVNYLIVLSFIL